MDRRSEFGFWAEDYVAQYLESRNYSILGRNYRKPWGEVDIIAEKSGVLIFVEVKASKSDQVGFEPENRANSEKLRRLVRAVQTYLASKRYSPEQDWQVDIVALTLSQNRGVVKIRHFKNVDL